MKMCADVAALPAGTVDLLVQHYIERPLTINGFKFDLRVYVAITCLEPLRVYVYEDGLVRCARACARCRSPMGFLGGALPQPHVARLPTPSP